MKTIHAREMLSLKRFWAVIVFSAAALASALAQPELAITEVMSSAARMLGANAVVQGSDYWKLKNFGPNSIFLDGYAFTDSAPVPLVSNCFKGLTLAAGQSVIFFRTNDTTRTLNEQQFREWWGSCLGTNVVVRGYTGPGFNASGDCVRLLDPQGQEVDRVCFGVARRGVSFV